MDAERFDQAIRTLANCAVPRRALSALLAVAAAGALTWRSPHPTAAARSPVRCCIYACPDGQERRRCVRQQRSCPPTWGTCDLSVPCITITTCESCQESGCP
jgi:hypothetical protein